jgi:heme exporter protein A
MRLIAGVLTPSGGSVELEVGGSMVPDEARSRYLGFVAPYLQLYDGLTLRENLHFVQRVRGASNDDNIAERAIQRVGLAGRGDDLVGTYSSGMKQRARFAVSQVVDPEILLLDEPSSNLDDAGTSIVQDIFAEHISRGKSISVATNSKLESDWCDSLLNVEQFKFRPKNRAASR